MRKPLIALTVAASVFALTAAGATGFSIQKGESDTAVLINPDGNQGSVEYNVEEPACDDAFTVDYALSGTSLSSVSLTEATDACTPPNVMGELNTFTPENIGLVNGESVVRISASSASTPLTNSSAGHLQISGASALGIPDGMYERTYLSYDYGQNYVEIELPSPYTGDSVNLDYEDLADTTIVTYGPNYQYTFTVEAGTDGSDEWTNVYTSPFPTPLTSQTTTAGVGSVDLSGYSKMRINVSVTYAGLTPYVPVT